MRPNNTKGQGEPRANQESHRENLYTSRDYYATHAAQRHQVSRRQALKAAGIGIAGLAALGLAGTVWYAHRAVACTVNGSVRTAPVGSTAQDIINLGYAHPSNGNLVAVCAEGEVPEILEQGSGERYTLRVNGEEVDVDAYRLAENDVVDFWNGADITEAVIAQNTEIPCGAQVPEDEYFLVKIGYVAQWGKNGTSSVVTGMRSGKTVDLGITEEPQDLIIALGNSIEPADGRRLVAITFDDGPDPIYTPQYLDILARHGARATFFDLGSQIDAGTDYVALAKRCVQEGHQVASHTYSHSDLLTLDDAARADEITRSLKAVFNACGTPTDVIRPPYGNFYGSSFLAYLRSGSNLAYTAYWGLDSQDWDIANQGYGVEDGAAKIVSNCTEVTGATLAANPEAFNGSIILMHDGGGDRERDVIALPQIIQTYQAQGFEFVTMNELLASCGTFPDWVTSGTCTRPDDAVIPTDDRVAWYNPKEYDPLTTLNSHDNS